MDERQANNTQRPGISLRFLKWPYSGRKKSRSFPDRGGNGELVHETLLIRKDLLIVDVIPLLAVH